MMRENCSTVYIFKNQKVLLHLHPKFHKYLPPGGHAEKNETPEETAFREVKEETGLDIAFISQENLWLSYPHAKSLYRPYLILLENVDFPYPHQHIDYIYLAKQIDKSIPHFPFSFFTLEQVEMLYKKNKVFSDTLQILKKVFSDKTLSLENLRV
jgi:8-oxo-dGTP pyrophosphatase MutT (NUDIX family)